MKEKKKSGLLTSWVVIILAFVIFFPVGIALLGLRVWNDVSNKKYEKQKQEQNRYMGAIVAGGMRQFSEIGAAMNKTDEEVKKALSAMIKDGVLQSAFLDENRGMLILASDKQQNVAFTQPVSGGSTSEPQESQQEAFTQEQAPSVACAAESAQTVAQIETVEHVQTAEHVPSLAPKAAKSSKPKRDLNPREAALRKLKIQCGAVLGGSLAVIIIFLFTPVAFLSLIGVLFLVGAFVVFPGEWMRTRRTYCKHCGQKYDYEADIAFQQEDVEEKELTVEATVDFQCHCRNCGEETEFKKRFVIARYNKEKATWKQFSLRNLCRKYFKD